MDQVVGAVSAERLADAVRDINAEVINFVEGCTSDLWARRTAEEGWTLSMTGMHIAGSHLAIGRWVHRTASALDITETLEDFEKSNGSDSRYQSYMSQAEVIERLRIYGAALERLVRDLSGDQLSTSGMHRGEPITAAQVVETIAVGHARGHLEHMVSAAGL
jgi:hypothetical protein